MFMIDCFECGLFSFLPVAAIKWCIQYKNAKARLYKKKHVYIRNSPSIMVFDKILKWIGIFKEIAKILRHFWTQFISLLLFPLAISAHSSSKQMQLSR